MRLAAIILIIVGLIFIPSLAAETYYVAGGAGSEPIVYANYTSNWSSYENVTYGNWVVPNSTATLNWASYDIDGRHEMQGIITTPTPEPTPEPTPTPESTQPEILVGVLLSPFTAGFNLLGNWFIIVIAITFFMLWYMLKATTRTSSDEREERVRLFADETADEIPHTPADFEIASTPAVSDPAPPAPVLDIEMEERRARKYSLDK
jgi:hypothetical protein